MLRTYKKIKTRLPINITPDILRIFERREYYKMPELKVKEKKNVFLTHYGIALKNLCLISHTLPNAWGIKKPNAGFIFQFLKKGIETFLVCKYGKSLKSIKLDKSKKYLFVYSPWFGYFSWVTESLPRIISVIDDHSNLTLILPETYSKKSFVKESLKMFPNLKHEIIPDGVHMQVPHMVIPELKPFTYVFDPETMKSFRNWVWAYVDSLNLNIQTYERIYVSRKYAKNRKLINEEEVLKLLSKDGFHEIAFEDYSFFEQIYLMKNCKILAGVHGAGFANIAFMKSGSSLIELIKEYSSYKEERPSYWRLCSAINIDYYIEYCKPKEYGNYDLWVGVDLIANLNSIETTIQKVLENEH